MKSIVKKLQLLKTIAQESGLSERDLHNVQEFFDYKEFQIGFDVLITQMHEYDIEIDDQICDLIISIGDHLKLSGDKYDFMKELIRGDRKIPKPVAEGLTKIIKSL